MALKGTFGHTLVLDQNWKSIHEFLDIAGIGDHIGFAQDRLNLLYNDYIRLRENELKAEGKRYHIVRGEDRRKSYESVNGSVLSGTDLHLVITLEAVAKRRKLTDEEDEALKAALFSVRGSINGYRKGGDRRKF